MQCSVSEISFRSSEYIIYISSQESYSIPEASSFETCTLFLYTVSKHFNTPTLHTLTNTHTVPTLSFQSASILPLLSYEAHSAGLHKDQREEFLKTVKSMPVIILPATKSNKSIFFKKTKKTWHQILSSLV